MSKNKTSNENQGTSNLALAALGAVPLLMVLGNSMLIPEFTKIKNVLNISQFQVGLLITLFSASAGIVIPFLGYISDQVGRKIIIIPAVLLYGLGGVISGLGAIMFNNSFNFILAGRIVQGIGAAGTAPIVMAMVGDLYQSNNRSQALGVIEASNGMGKVLSPIIGSAIALISWWALFFSYALLSIPVALGVYFLTKEPGHEINKQGPGVYFKKIVEIFQEKGLSLVVSLLSGMTTLFILFGVLSHISDVLEESYKFRGLTKGLIIAIPIFFMSTTSYLTGHYLKHKGKYFKLSVITGLTFSGVALIFLPLVQNIFLYIGFFTMVGMGSGFVLTAVNTLVTSSTSHDQRGGITSIYNSLRFLGVALGPPTFSLINGTSEKTMSWTATAIAFTVGTLVLIFLKETKLLPGDDPNGGEDDSQGKTQQANFEDEKEGIFTKNKLR